MGSSPLVSFSYFRRCSRKSVSTFAIVLLSFAPTTAAVAREPGEIAGRRAEVSGWRVHPRSRYDDEMDTRRGRRHSRLRPHLDVRRRTSQNLSEELKKMMTPGLRTERLSEEGRDSLRQRAKAIPITSRDKGEFTLPESTASTQAESKDFVATNSVDEAEKGRMEKHHKRFESMSDPQQSRMQDQMRRVRPLSIEERADAAQRDP